MGAEMGIEHINAQGGIKSLGGAKMKLVVIDCGDTTEKAKNAAQRMVAQEPDLVARDRLLSQLLHAGSDRGHRACANCRPDTVLFGSADRARLQIHLPDRGAREPAIGTRPARTDEACRNRVRQAPEDGGDADGQHGDVGRDRQGAQGEDLCAGRPATGRGGGLDAAAFRRHAADPEGQVGPSGPAAVHAQRDLGRQTRPGKNQRVRARPGQDSDRLLLDHDCRARHAAKRQHRRRRRAS